MRAPQSSFSCDGRLFDSPHGSAPVDDDCILDAHRVCSYTEQAFSSQLSSQAREIQSESE